VAQRLKNKCQAITLGTLNTSMNSIQVSTSCHAIYRARKTGHEKTHSAKSTFR